MKRSFYIWSFCNFFGFLLWCPDFPFIVWWVLWSCAIPQCAWLDSKMIVIEAEGEIKVNLLRREEEKLFPGYRTEVIASTVILVKRVYLWPLILLYQHQQFTTTHRRNKLSLFWVQNLDHHLRSKAEWGCYFSFKLGSHENQHCALFWGAKLSLECFIADVDLWSLKDLASLEDRLRLSFVIEIWLKREWKTSRSWRYNAMKKIKHNLINLRAEDGVDKPSHPVFHNILVFVE